MSSTFLRRRLAAVSIAAVAAASLSAGCGGGDGSSAPASTDHQQRGALAYAQCMRAHGIDDFPDPDGSGEIQLDAHPGSDLDPGNPRFKAANAACKSLMPHQDRLPVKKLKAANLAYAKCMRGHGISSFPDPGSDGRLRIQAAPGSELDPNNPQFKAANSACEHLLIAGTGDRSLNENGNGS